MDTWKTCGPCGGDGWNWWYGIRKTCDLCSGKGKIKS